MTGEEHSDVPRICFVNDFLVSNGASGLHNGRCTCISRLLQSVFEREECIRGKNAALRSFAGSASSDFDRFNTARLSGPNAHGGGPLNHDNGVGFDLLANPNGELHAVDLFGCWLALGHRGGLLPINDGRFLCLNQHPLQSAFGPPVARGLSRSLGNQWSAIDGSFFP